MFINTVYLQVQAAFLASLCFISKILNIKVTINDYDIVVLLLLYKFYCLCSEDKIFFFLRPAL